MARRLFFTLIAFSFFQAAAFAKTAPFVERLRAIVPGMTQDDVIAALGEPEAVVHKSVDATGRPVEVWRYFPGLELPARAGAGVPAESGVAAAVSVPHSAGPGDEADRIRRDMDFWSGVQNAAVTNPADANYRPALSRSRPPEPPAVAVRSEAYFITFVNGVVQSVQLSQIQ